MTIGIEGERQSIDSETCTPRGARVCLTAALLAWKRDVLRLVFSRTTGKSPDSVESPYTSEIYPHDDPDSLFPPFRSSFL